MTDNARVLLELAKRFAGASYTQLANNVNADSIYGGLLSQVVRSRSDIRKNNDLLKSWLYPMLEKPEEITGEAALDLYELAQALFQPWRNIDSELAIRIYEALAKRARGTDADMLVKCLYWQGLVMHYQYRHLLYDEVLAIFSEAAAFRFKYTEIENFETREYINRALGNIAITEIANRKNKGAEPFITASGEALAFWRNPDIRAYDPKMPFDKFIYTVILNTGTMLDMLRREDGHATERLADIVYKDVLYAVSHAKEHYESTAYGRIAARLDYSKICAEYHVGLIHGKEAGERLLKMAGDVQEGDYTSDALYRKIKIPLTAIYYLERDEKYPREELAAVTKRVIAEVTGYCSTIPPETPHSEVDSMVSEFVHDMPGRVDSEQLINTVLELTVYRHLPTFVHSSMVSWLSELICEYFCRYKPEFLIGVRGTQTAGDVRNAKEEVVDFARMCGLCHDVGKIVYINTIANNGRELSDREMILIRSHVDKSRELLIHSGYMGLAEIVYNHHRWYNGKGGYPKELETLSPGSLPIIGILAVADSIDAATDILGRAYSKGLSLDAVIAEIQSRSGTQYAPDVADALSDPLLYDAIKNQLSDKRHKAYNTAYTRLKEPER